MRFLFYFILFLHFTEIRYVDTRQALEAVVSYIPPVY